MPPKRKISNAAARRFLRNLLTQAHLQLIDNAHQNRAILRDPEYLGEDPQYFMNGYLPGENRFVSMQDVRQAAANRKRQLYNMNRFRFKGKAKKKYLGKRKRK